MANILRTPKEQRKRFRNKMDIGSTSGMCPGFQHANLVILPKKYAYDFLLFCYRNPKSCPIVDVMEEGIFEPNVADADIRTDVSKYWVYKNGELYQEVNDIKKYWTSNFVTFLLGCSVTFEN